jgi:hypothetical protein
LKFTFTTTKAEEFMKSRKEWHPELVLFLIGDRKGVEDIEFKEKWWLGVVVLPQFIAIK